MTKTSIRIYKLPEVYIRPQLLPVERIIIETIEDYPKLKKRIRELEFENKMLKEQLNYKKL